MSGRIALFSVAAKASAPLGALALAQVAGCGRVMATVGTACAIAAFALAAYHRVPFRPGSK
ncbi:hypothetical protein GCM10010466_07830 [Planomonospora alba]|uniref:Uncharacterized protein n=1 Tax=Planomonospora alba TaxID=161354 RepID=A0ABP6MSB3_9ACTN